MTENFWTFSRRGMTALPPASGGRSDWIRATGSASAPMEPAARIDVDFSLALNDRTGKLFLGRDIIDALGHRVGRVHYGRFRAVPRFDLMRRIAGRLTHEETKARLLWRRGIATSPNRRPVLHLDPLSVLRHRLSGADIVLCHDIGPVTHPDCFAPGVDRLYARAYADIRAARPNLVFVSRATQSAFHALYGGDFASSTVIHIPIRPGVQQGPAAPVAGAEGPFLLTVGSVGTRKNQHQSIAAFARSGLAREGWRYVVAGGDEPGAKVVRDLADVTPGVVMTGYVDDAELRWLYRHAAGFVLMSRLEGFGMPVAEAARARLPCLVSASSALAEVGGDGVLTADPEDVHAIAKGMRTLATLPKAERARRLMATRAHVAQFDRDRLLSRWRDLIDGLDHGVPASTAAHMTDPNLPCTLPASDARR